MVDESVEHKSMGVTLGVFVPICLVSCALLWILYAYRNPHTRSGQLLIQVSDCVKVNNFQRKHINLRHFKEIYVLTNNL